MIILEAIGITILVFILIYSYIGYIVYREAYEEKQKEDPFNIYSSPVTKTESYTIQLPENVKIDTTKLEVPKWAENHQKHIEIHKELMKEFCEEKKAKAQRRRSVSTRRGKSSAKTTKQKSSKRTQKKKQRNASRGFRL